VLGRALYGFAPTHRRVGTFKGMIRVLEQDPAHEEHPFFDMKELRKARSFRVAVNVIAAKQLVQKRPLELLGGRVKLGGCDPYLKIKVNGTRTRRFSTKKKSKAERKAMVGTVNPDFHERFELDGACPTRLTTSAFSYFY